MDITGSTALVTGANRGLGRHFIDQLIERGAERVYVTAQRLSTLDWVQGRPRLEALELDITDLGQIASAAERAGSTDLLINNAGIATQQNLVTGDLGRVS